MLLRNYDNIEVISRLRASTPAMPLSGTYGLDDNFNIKPTSNETINYVGSHCDMSLFNFKNGANSYGGGGVNYTNLIVGSSDTPVTYNDTSLGASISTANITNLSESFTDPVYDEVNQTWTREYKKVFSAVSDITIKEIGIVKGLSCNSGNYQKYFLVYREVLETPIEVPTGANVVITFKAIVSANPNKPTDYVATASVE